MAEFPKGFIFKKPSDKAPSFVKGKVSINMNEFLEWASVKENKGWINLDLMESKEGKYYSVLDNYDRAMEVHRKKDNKDEEEEIKPENIPF